MQANQIRRSTADRRAGIVAAVLELAAGRSPGAITAADIAQAIGLSQGAVFKHFPNKDAIWLAAIDWVAERLLAELAAAEEGAASPVEGLRRVFQAHVRFVVAHPGVPRLLFHELQQPADTPVKLRVRGILESYRRLLARLLAAAARAGQIPRDLDREAAAMLFVGSIQGLVVQSLLAGDTQRMSAEAERVFAIYLRGIREES